VISQKAKYALKALVVLAGQGTGKSMQTGEIASAAGIPRKFLEQILLQLKLQGLLTSRRGRSGGYSLAQEPDEITVSSILRIVDGPIAPLPCISRTAYSRCPDCPDESECAIRRMFADTYASTLVMLERTTLAGALRQPLFAEGDLPSLPQSAVAEAI
jgi:Rrf2 family protein